MFMLYKGSHTKNNFLKKFNLHNFKIKQNIGNIFRSHPLCILANIDNGNIQMETFRVNFQMRQATLWNREYNCRLFPHLNKLKSSSLVNGSAFLQALNRAALSLLDSSHLEIKI